MSGCILGAMLAIVGWRMDVHARQESIACEVRRALETACVLECVDSCVRTCEDCDVACDDSCNSKCGLEGPEACS